MSAFSEMEVALKSCVPSLISISKINPGSWPWYSAGPADTGIEEVNHATILEVSCISLRSILPLSMFIIVRVTTLLEVAFIQGCPRIVFVSPVIFHFNLLMVSSITNVFSNSSLFSTFLPVSKLVNSTSFDPATTMRTCIPPPSPPRTSVVSSFSCSAAFHKD